MSRLFGDIRQLGMVVRDADAAMQEWLKLGVGPWYVLHFTVDDYFYRGEPSPPPQLKLCFAHSGGLQLELIEQQNDVPSAYREFLDAGREGCQHVCAWFADHQSFQTRRQELLDQGFTIVHEGGFRASDGSFAYFETGEPGGLQFELSEALTPLSAQILDRMLGETREWDGVTDPIRSFM
jgi:catechol 2,3-dioxygenase-like lactoylglutathione lyase family enzyme